MRTMVKCGVLVGASAIWLCPSADGSDGFGFLQGTVTQSADGTEVRESSSGYWRADGSFVNRSSGTNFINFTISEPFIEVRSSVETDQGFSRMVTKLFVNQVLNTSTILVDLQQEGNARVEFNLRVQLPTGAGFLTDGDGFLFRPYDGPGGGTITYDPNTVTAGLYTVGFDGEASQFFSITFDRAFPVIPNAPTAAAFCVAATVAFRRRR